MSLVLDIETIPSSVCDEHADAIRAMAEKRDMDAESFGALCPVLCHVVAVGFHNTDTDGTKILLDESVFPARGNVPDHVLTSAEFCADEKNLFERAAAVLQRARHIVTFNGRGFDIPVLFHRSLICGVTPAPIIGACAWQKPWESRPHTDLLNQFTFGGATGKYTLEAYCLGYGVPNPKAHGDGGTVRELAARGDTAALVEYLTGDLRATAALYKRWTNSTATAA